MKTKRTHWGVLALITFIAMLLGAYILPPLPTERVRPRRIQQAVNNIAPVFGVQPSTNPAPVVPTKR